MIAKFMNVDIIQNKGMSDTTHKEVIKSFLSSASYHTSWDWLIPVIDKISKYNEANYGAAMEDILPSWAIWSNDIEVMYTAVVDAIKSINEQENTEQ